MLHILSLLSSSFFIFCLCTPWEHGKRATSSAVMKVNCSVDPLSVGQVVTTRKDLRSKSKHKSVIVATGDSTYGSCPFPLLCCRFEEFLEEYHRVFLHTKSSPQVLRINVGTEEGRNLAAWLAVEDIPQVSMVKKGKAIHLEDDLWDFSTASAVLSDFIEISSSTSTSSFPILRSWEELEEFLGSFSRLTEVHSVWIRILVLGEPDEEELEEIQAIREVRRWRSVSFDYRLFYFLPFQDYFGSPFSVRFGQVTNPALIKEVRKAVKTAGGGEGCEEGQSSLAVFSVMEGEWVQNSKVFKLKQKEQERSASLGRILLPRFKGSSFLLDPRELNSSSNLDTVNSFSFQVRRSCRSVGSYSESESLREWALSRALPLLGEFSTSTGKMYERTGSPLVMMFLNRTDPANLNHLLIMKKNAEKYSSFRSGKVKFPKFLYGFSDLLGGQMSQLGLNPEGPFPAVALNWVAPQQLSWQAAGLGGQPLTAQDIDSIVQEYFRGEGVEAAFKLDSKKTDKKAKPVPKRDFSKEEHREVIPLEALDLEGRLRYIKPLGRADFLEEVMDERSDVLLYAYSSLEGPLKNESLHAAAFLNRCAERFEELEIPTVKVVRIDVNTDSPRGLPGPLPTIPGVYLFPAFQKVAAEEWDTWSEDKQALVDELYADKRLYATLKAIKIKEGSLPEGQERSLAAMEEKLRTKWSKVDFKNIDRSKLPPEISRVLEEDWDPEEEEEEEEEVEL